MFVFTYSILNSATIIPNILKKKKFIIKYSNNNKFLIHKISHITKTNFYFCLKATKTRAEVRGGGKKPLKQKGTGRARIGSLRSPLNRGGGVIWGPQSKIIIKKRNFKELKLTLQTILYNSRFHLFIFDKFYTSSYKTKNIFCSFGILKNNYATGLFSLNYQKTLNCCFKNSKYYLYRQITKLNLKLLLTMKIFLFDEEAFRFFINSTY
jgi:50S ribosomal protein L4